MRIIENYSPFSYQADSVSRAIEMCDEVGGFFLMDSTGLGKTIVSLTTAINVLKDNDRILIITPEKNKSTWLEVISLIDFNVELVNYSNIPLQADYQFIIIDEAHNLRNTKAQSYQNMWKLIFSHASFPYVALLSATPFQNTIQEFWNTVSLIPFKQNTFAFIHLGVVINNIIEIQKKIEKINRFTKNGISYKQISEKVKLEFELNEILRSNLIPELGEFCLRTTREDIVKLYPFDTESVGVFPIIKTNKVEYEYSKEFRELVRYINQTVTCDKETDEEYFPFAIYNLHKYNESTDNEFGSINGLMRTFLLKRLDSSIPAFIESVMNMINKINIILDSETQTDTELNEYTFDDRKYLLGNSFLLDCKQDLLILNNYLDKAKLSVGNEKESKLIEIINNSTGKVVIFTEYVETLNQLSNILKDNAIRFIKIDGTSKDSDLEKVAYDFNANINPNLKTNNYKVLLCTDVMSEGVSLHEANTLIHYDSKWNPQRTIQRNGRVDRIFKDKRKTHEINVHYFSVNELIDFIIHFENRVKDKMNMSNEILTFDWRKYKTNIFKQEKYKIGVKYLIPDSTDPKTFIGFVSNSEKTFFNTMGILHFMRNGAISANDGDYREVMKSQILEENDYYDTESKIGGISENDAISDYFGIYYSHHTVVYMDHFMRFYSKETYFKKNGEEKIGYWYKKGHTMLGCCATLRSMILVLLEDFFKSPLMTEEFPQEQREDHLKEYEENPDDDKFKEINYVKNILNNLFENYGVEKWNIFQIQNKNLYQANNERAEKSYI